MTAETEIKKNNRWTRFIIILVWFTGYQWVAALIPRTSERHSDISLIISSVVVLMVGYLYGKLLAHPNIWKMVLEITAAGIIGHLLYNFTFLGGNAHSTIARLEDMLSYLPYTKEAIYVTMVTMYGGFTGYAFRRRA